MGTPMMWVETQQPLHARISQRDKALGADQDHPFTHTVENDLQAVTRFFDVPEQERVIDGDARLGRQLGDEREIIRRVLVGAIAAERDHTEHLVTTPHRHVELGANRSFKRRAVPHRP
jgi:hypothetical protein